MRIDLLLGGLRGISIPARRRFQYPRADRLIVGASIPTGSASSRGMFQYPRADRLIVGGCGDPAMHVADGARFSILVRIDLLLG